MIAVSLQVSDQETMTMRPIKNKSRLMIAFIRQMTLALILFRDGPVADSQQINVEPRDGIEHTATRLVQLLIADIESDEEQFLRRTASAHSAPLVPTEDIDKHFPVGYSFERLIALGPPAAKDLLDIANSRSFTEREREVAWQILISIDDRIYLPKLVKAVDKKLLEPYSAAAITINYIPTVEWSTEYADDNALNKWLHLFSESKYDEARLRIFDIVMKDERLIEEYSFHVFRWFNMLNGVNFDDWLLKRSREAYSYREKCLEKGYDPVFAFRNLSRNLFDGIIDEGIIRVVPEVDRVACRELLCASNDIFNKSGLYPSHDPGWGLNVKNWYWKYRSTLHFDEKKRRFAPN